MITKTAATLALLLALGTTSLFSEVIDNFEINNLRAWHPENCTSEWDNTHADASTGALKWTCKRLPGDKWAIISLWIYPAKDWTSHKTIHVRVAQENVTDTKVKVIFLVRNDQTPRPESTGIFFFDGTKSYRTIDIPLGDTARNKVVLLSFGLNASALSADEDHVFYIDNISIDDQPTLPTP